MKFALSNSKWTQYKNWLRISKFKHRSSFNRNIKIKEDKTTIPVILVIIIIVIAITITTTKITIIILATTIIITINITITIKTDQAHNMKTNQMDIIKTTIVHTIEIRGIIMIMERIHTIIIIIRIERNMIIIITRIMIVTYSRKIMKMIRDSAQEKEHSKIKLQ